MANLAEVAVAITGNPTSFESALASAATKGEAFQARLSGAFGNLQNNVLTAFSAIAAHPVGLIISSLTGLIGALSSLAEKSKQVALEQAALEKRFGLTNTEAAGLQLHARMAGISSESLSNALRNVNRNLGEAAQNGGRAGAALDRLGLNAADLTAIPMPDALALVGDRLATVENRYERASLATAILSRRGAELEGIMRGGSSAMQANREQAESMGFAMGGLSREISEQNRIIKATNVVLENTGTSIWARIGDIWDKAKAAWGLIAVGLFQGREGVDRLITSIAAKTTQDERAEALGRTTDNVNAINKALENLDRQAEHAGLNRYQIALADLRNMMGITNEEIERGSRAIRDWRQTANNAFGTDTLRNIQILQDGIERWTWGAREAAFQMGRLRGEIQDNADRTVLWNSRLEDALTTVKSLLEQSLTPAERLRDVYRQLDYALQRGAITQQTFLRAAAQAERSALGQHSTSLAAAVSVGSVEALTVLNEARVNAGDSAQERAAAHLSEIVRQNEERERTLHEMRDTLQRIRETGIFGDNLRIGNLDN